MTQTQDSESYGTVRTEANNNLEKIVKQRAAEKVEEILAKIKPIFSERKGIESVLLRGSAAMGNFVEGKSDIDLSVILDVFDFYKITSINTDLNEISKKIGTKMSVTYTDMNELDRDKELGFHYHGTKCSGYNREIGKESKIIYGKDLRPYFLQCFKADAKIVYFDCSSKIAEYIKLTCQDKKEAYKKGINYSFITAKQILNLDGIYEINKKNIIALFRKIDSNASDTLVDADTDSKIINEVNVNDEKLRKIFDFLVFCKAYVGKKLKGEIYGTR